MERDRVCFLQQHILLSDCIITEHFEKSSYVQNTTLTTERGVAKFLSSGYWQVVRQDTHLHTNNTRSKAVTWVFWKELWDGHPSWWYELAEGWGFLAERTTCAKPTLRGDTKRCAFLSDAWANGWNKLLTGFPTASCFPNTNHSHIHFPKP